MPDLINETQRRVLAALHRVGKPASAREVCQAFLSLWCETISGRYAWQCLRDLESLRLAEHRVGKNRSWRPTVKGAQFVLHVLAERERGTTERRTSDVGVPVSSGI